MNLLLDTHIILWATTRPAQLSQEARRLLLDEQNTLFFSAASIWEIAIKHGLGKPDFTTDPSVLNRALLDHCYVSLPITGAHALAVTRLPLIHRDPFDRLLIAQATAEGITLLTADQDIAAYPGPIMLV